MRLRRRTRWLLLLPLAGLVVVGAALAVAWRSYVQSGRAAAPQAVAPEMPAPVADALAALRTGQRALAADWSYHERLVIGSDSELLLHDASRPVGSRWRVLAINGRPPAAADEQRLAAQAQAGARATAALPGASDWLADSAYRLVATTSDTLVYQLQPRVVRADSDDVRALLPHLSGRLVIARDDHRPLGLRLDNFESFSPRFGVTVESFGFRADFRRLGADGPVVVARMATRVRGRVLWLKSFDNRTSVVLSGFESAPPPASAPKAATAPRWRRAQASRNWRRLSCRSRCRLPLRLARLARSRSRAHASRHRETCRTA